MVPIVWESRRRDGRTLPPPTPLESSKTNRARTGDVNSTKGLGEELSRVCLETAARENAPYSDFRLVNTVTEVVSVINDNPPTEELNDPGAGIRISCKDSDRASPAPTQPN